MPHNKIHVSSLILFYIVFGKPSLILLEERKQDISLILIYTYFAIINVTLQKLLYCYMLKSYQENYGNLRDMI